MAGRTPRLRWKTTGSSEGAVGVDDFDIAVGGEIVPGDLLVIIAGNDNPGALAQWPAKADWNLLLNGGSEVGGVNPECKLAVYYRIADGTEPDTENVAYIANANIGGFYACYTDVDPDDPFHVLGAEALVEEDTPATTFPVTGFATTRDRCLALAMVSTSEDGCSPFAWPEGWTKADDVESVPAGSGWSGSWATQEIAPLVIDGETVADFSVESQVATGGVTYAFALNPRRWRTAAEMLEEVLKFLPGEYVTASELLAGVAEELSQVERAGHTLFDLTTVGQGIGKWLTHYGESLGVQRATGESDVTLRSRIRRIRDRITRSAILDAAQALFVTSGITSEVPSIQGTVSEADSGGTAVATLDIDPPANIEADELLVICVGTFAGNFDLDDISGWTQAAQDSSSVHDTGAAVYWKRATGSETTVTISLVSGTERMAARWMRFPAGTTFEGITAVAEGLPIQDTDTLIPGRTTSGAKRLACMWGAWEQEPTTVTPGSNIDPAWSIPFDVLASGTGVSTVETYFSTAEVEMQGNTPTFEFQNDTGNIGYQAYIFTLAPAVSPSTLVTMIEWFEAPFLDIDPFYLDTAGAALQRGAGNTFVLFVPELTSDFAEAIYDAVVNLVGPESSPFGIRAAGVDWRMVLIPQIVNAITNRLVWHGMPFMDYEGNITESNNSGFTGFGPNDYGKLDVTNLTEELKLYAFKVKWTTASPTTDQPLIGIDDNSGMIVWVESDGTIEVSVTDSGGTVRASASLSAVLGLDTYNEWWIFVQFDEREDTDGDYVGGHLKVGKAGGTALLGSTALTTSGGSAALSGEHRIGREEGVATGSPGAVSCDEMNILEIREYDAQGDTFEFTDAVVLDVLTGTDDRTGDMALQYTGSEEKAV